MWLFDMTTFLFSRFDHSMNYKIQRLVHVEVDSVVLLSGRSEAS